MPTAEPSTPAPTYGKTGQLEAGLARCHLHPSVRARPEKSHPRRAACSKLRPRAAGRYRRFQDAATESRPASTGSASPAADPAMRSATRPLLARASGTLVDTDQDRFILVAVERLDHETRRKQRDLVLGRSPAKQNRDAKLGTRSPWRETTPLPSRTEQEFLLLLLGNPQRAVLGPMLTALIVGGTGLISTGIVKHLLARGAQVSMYNRGQRERTVPGRRAANLRGPRGSGHFRGCLRPRALRRRL